MSLASALPNALSADLEVRRCELARARQLARAWAETLPEPRRRDMAALFTRVAIETYRAKARPHAILSSPSAEPHGRLDRAVAELAAVGGARGCAAADRRGRMLAASTVFVALYVDAIEGSGTYLGPKHVYRMTDEQAAQVDDASRAGYSASVLRTCACIEGRRRYQDNTREPIRDETLREGAGGDRHRDRAHRPRHHIEQATLRPGGELSVGQPVDRIARIAAGNEIVRGEGHGGPPPCSPSAAPAW